MPKMSCRAIAFALFLFALALRLVGLRWGLPTQTHWYSYHPDEAQMLVAIVSLDFWSGDFNPDFFNYPSLFIYLSAFAHLVAGGFGLVRPISNDPTQVWMYAHDVLLCARVVTALLGAATIPFVFLIARSIGGVKIGVLAALLMALSSGHLQHSHFATVDVPSTFFITLCLWLTARALRENAEAKWQTKQLLWAAFVAGLAAATKYNAVLILCAPLAASWILARRKTISLALAPVIVGIAIIGFLLGCPYSVLNFPAFWGSDESPAARYELLVHPRQGHGDLFLNTGNGWVYHLTHNAPFLLTAPILVAAVFGLVSTPRLTSGARKTISLILVLWCAFYFFALGFSNVRFMRYLLPLIPVLCVFAALGVLALRRFGSTAKRSAGVLLLLIAAWGARDILYDFIVVDPRDQAAQWIMQNASTPASIGMIESPWFFSTPLSPLDSPPYRRLSESQLSQLSGGKYQFVVTGFDAQKLAAEKPQWFITSTYEWRDKSRLQDAEFLKFLAALEADYSIAARFQNAAPFALPGREFGPHDFVYNTPEIRIYRRK